MPDSVIQTDVYADSHIDGNVTSPDNALGPPNGVFTFDVGNSSWTSRWQMQLPPTSWYSGTQSVKVLARKETGQSGTPQVTGLNLYQGGVLIRNLLDASYDVTSGTGEDVSGDFEASEVQSGTIEIEVVTSAAGGNPNTRTAVQIDAITWTVNHLEFQPGTKINAWGGSMWVQGELRIFDGTNWIPAVVKRWNGSTWEEA